METLPIQIKPIEDEIIELSLNHSPKEISEKLSMPLREIFSFLSTPAAKEFRELKLSYINNNVQYKRLEKANDLIDRLMVGIEKLVDLDPTKWKMAHVRLFELLTKEIPDQLKNFNQVNNVQINNFEQTKDEKNIEMSIEKSMDYLPSEAKMKFWREVEDLANKYAKEYGVSSI